MPDFSSSFPLQFLFFSTDQNVDFYSRCCHFFSDIILADLYTHTHTRTTKMPSDEQQLAEPLLDDGGNDRFVLFPLKYDAVWEMVRLSYDIISSIFKNLSVFEAFEICACADVLSSLSLSLFLLSITVQESASVVLDRWYVLLLLLVRSCLCSSLVLLLLCSRFGHFKN